MKKLLYERFINPKFDKTGRLINATFNVPDGFNFAYDVVDVLAKEQPDKKALVWCNEAGDEKVFTFSDLKKLSDKTAAILKREGVRHGDSVMLIMGRSYQFWYTILALHKLGAIAVPCSNQLSVQDIIFRIEKAQVRNIILTNNSGIVVKCKQAHAHCPANVQFFSVNGAAEGFIDLDMEIEKQKKTNFKRIATNSSDDFLMYFTSGTTGHPKGAMHNFLYPLGHIVTAKYWHNVKPDGLHFTVSDSGWGKCVWGKLYGQWLSETCVLVYDFEKFSASNMCGVIQKYSVTSFCAPPTVYRFFAKECGKDGSNCVDIKSVFASVKHLCSAGESLNSETFNFFKEQLGLEIKQGFGQTETTMIIGYLGNDTVFPDSMGRANPVYKIKLMQDGKEVGADESGEIAVDLKGCTIGIMDRYMDEPNATAAVKRDGLYYTGDLATRDKDGNFYYVGRADDMFKASGYRIGPFEIESVLMKHPAVRECAIVGVDDEIRGSVIKACIVLAGSFKPSEKLIKELQEFVKSNTAPYKYPRIVEFFEELPKTASGKIMRKELRFA